MVSKRDAFWCSVETAATTKRHRRLEVFSVPEITGITKFSRGFGIIGELLFSNPVNLIKIARGLLRYLQHSLHRGVLYVKMSYVLMVQ